MHGTLVAVGQPAVVGGDVFARLARALAAAGDQLPAILDAFTTTLTTTLCAGCTIEVITSPAPGGPAPARRLLTPRQVILPLGGLRLIHGWVTITRDAGAPPFTADELEHVATCIAYATLAAEGAIHLAAERAALRTEHARAEQFHRTMVSAFGHDLRGPVSAILIGTEMLVARHQGDPSLADVVNRIVSFANRMTGMVDQLLDLSRARLRGGIPLARVELRLAPLLESVIEELAARHPRTLFSVSGDAELKGAWDPARLRQITASLVGNALRYGFEDGPISIVMAQEAGRTSFAVHNEVRDAPIPPEAQTDLFEPYRSSAEEHGSPGLGLGLYIVRELVEAHGGRIAVESIATGTTFRVVLPNHR